MMTPALEQLKELVKRMRNWPTSYAIELAALIPQIEREMQNVASCESFPRMWKRLPYRNGISLCCFHLPGAV